MIDCKKIIVRNPSVKFAYLIQSAPQSPEKHTGPLTMNAILVHNRRQITNTKFLREKTL